MNASWKTMLLVVPLALVSACTDEAKAPAEAAMTAAGAAVDSLKGDATRLAPEEVKEVESRYETAKDFLANKDYQGVLTFAKDIPTRVRAVLAKVDAVKAAQAAQSAQAAQAGAR